MLFFSFDPLVLLLDASLELVKKTAREVPNPSAANDEGITVLHNAICAGHIDIVRFLVEFGCDVNAQDSDGWTPLHCAASCNNLEMVKFLVDMGLVFLPLLYLIVKLQLKNVKKRKKVIGVVLNIFVLFKKNLEL